MSVSICLEEISFLEKTCRACSRYDPNDSMTFRPIFNDGHSGKPSVEVAGVFEEFLLWNLEIKENDGLPQQMCNDCLERFIQVKLFREEVLDSQRLLSSYLKGDTNDPKHGGVTITIETLPMSSGSGDRIGYVSPSKLIEYVGSEEENEENPTLNKSETDYFEENESDYLFNHPNQIETNTLMDFKTDKPESIEFKPSCTKSFEEKSVEQPNEVKETQSDGGNTKCELCLKTFRTTHHLMRHKRMFHIRVDMNCPICGRKFEKITQRNFDYHLRSHHAKKYKCAYCEKSFQQKVHLINHERTHTGEKPFGCNVCGKKFRQQSSLQEHLMTHKDPHPFKCEICGKGFTQRSGLRLHVRLHNSVKQYQCEFCGEGFHQKVHLDLHVMNHTGERPFQCEFCSKSFRQGYQLGNHIHTAHFQNSDSIRNGEYQCSQCDREFTNAMDLIQHKKSHDNGERKFLCPQCGAGFKKETHLNLHVDAVHLKKKPYECNYCNKTFAQLSNLNEHLKIHKGSKQHKCNICDKSFTLRKTLLMHEAIHTGEKRFKCNFCDESFVYRQTLGAHIMNHFRDENEEEYTINEEVLGDEDFLDYNDDLELNDEFQLIDQYVQMDN